MGERRVAAVDLKGVRKRYGALVVADGIDLAIAHEELVCLLGPSGCGKTTTLRLIAGFMAPDEGSIVGRRPRAVPTRRHGAAGAAQHVDDLPELRALAAHDGRGERRLRADAARRRPGRDRAPGRAHPRRRQARRRCATATPASSPAASSSASRWPAPWWSSRETLLLDEPLSNLDTNLREEMRFEIRRLHDEFRYTTVYVTHDQAEAMTTADRIVVMNARPDRAGRAARGRLCSGRLRVRRPLHRRHQHSARHAGGRRRPLRPAADRCGNAGAAGAGRHPVSIRPDDVELARAAADGANAFDRHRAAPHLSRRPARLPARAAGRHPDPRRHAAARPCRGRQRRRRAPAADRNAAPCRADRRRRTGRADRRSARPRAALSRSLEACCSAWSALLLAVLVVLPLGWLAWFALTDAAGHPTPGQPRPPGHRPGAARPVR